MKIYLTSKSEKIEPLGKSWDPWTFVTCTVWVVVRLNHLHPFCPRDDCFHLFQKCFLAGLARAPFVFQIAECLLHCLDHLSVDTSILQKLIWLIGKSTPANWLQWWYGRRPLGYWLKSPGDQLCAGSQACPGYHGCVCGSQTSICCLNIAGAMTVWRSGKILELMRILTTPSH